MTLNNIVSIGLGRDLLEQKSYTSLELETRAPLSEVAGEDIDMLILLKEW